MIKTGLTAEELERSALLLNGLLADHFTLLLKTWQFHWNVVGNSFGSYHEGMLKLYEAEIERVDDVAERIRALGKRPLGSMEAMLQNNHIQEFKMDASLPGGKTELTGKDIGIPSLEKAKVQLYEFSTQEFSITPTELTSKYNQIPLEELVKMLVALL